MHMKIVFLVVFAFLCYAQAKSTKGKTFVTYLWRIYSNIDQNFSRESTFSETFVRV